MTTTDPFIAVIGLDMFSKDVLSNEISKSETMSDSLQVRVTPVYIFPVGTDAVVTSIPGNVISLVFQISKVLVSIDSGQKLGTKASLPVAVGVSSCSWIRCPITTFVKMKWLLVKLYSLET